MLARIIPQLDTQHPSRAVSRKDGLENGSTLMDCLWGEKIYGSINIAQIDDGAITPEYADRLRRKYLWGEDI